MDYLSRVLESIGLKKENEHKLHYLSEMDYLHSYLEKYGGPHLQWSNINNLFKDIKNAIIKACYDNTLNGKEDINYGEEIAAMLEDKLYDDITINGDFLYGNLNSGITGPSKIIMYNLLLTYSVKKNYLTETEKEEMIQSLYKTLHKLY